MKYTVDPSYQCVCFRFPYSRIKEIIIKNNCKNYKDVRQYCVAGTRCGSCVGDIQAMCEDVEKETNEQLHK